MFYFGLFYTVYGLFLQCSTFNVKHVSLLNRIPHFFKDHIIFIYFKTIAQLFSHVEPDTINIA